MIKILYFLTILAASSVAHAQTQTTYTILAEDAAGLWGQADGTGAGNEIVQAAFAAMGDKVSLQIVPYNRCKTYVMNGRALACFGMSWSEELKGKVVFPKERIYTNTGTIFVRKTDGRKYKSIADIPPRTKIGTVLGYEYPDPFPRLLKSEVFILDEALSEVQSLKKLALGRTELVIANLDDLKSAEYLLKQAGVGDSVQTAFVLESAGTFLGFSVTDPKTTMAMKTFDAGMAKIKTDGTLAKILRTWKAKLTAE
jgi:polar amino acid transport system substrate-binding protein